MSIVKNILNIKKQINNTQLIVVTKTQSLDNIKKAYSSGERNFGENRVSELIIKKELLPNNIKWHMIGHLQTNKVKSITSFIHLIHSVDRLKLLNEINKCGKLDNRIINCLIQVKIAKENTKHGFSEKESIELLQSNHKEKYPYVNIKGIMGMATFTNNTNTIEAEFKRLKKIYDHIKYMKILSMGMSNDYQIACKAGSNMIRIGSAIFK
tara:strand:+ start:199 stop:828 length:630 start_codon:yes stop_codon:yes gene_type:complete